MMGGVLEIRKEDELKKDVPIPSFITNKEQDDWTEEEHKIFKEYEKKVKDLQEEREKYRKVSGKEKQQTVVLSKVFAYCCKTSLRAQTVLNGVVPPFR